MCRLCMLAILLAGTMPSPRLPTGKQIVIATMKKISPSAKIERVRSRRCPGSMSLVASGRVFFISDDGKFLIQGGVFNINTHKNLGDKHMAAMRKELSPEIPEDKRISFRATEAEIPRDRFHRSSKCPYCREFHKQIAEYNKLGIAVDYVLFPLSIHPGADKMARDDLVLQGPSQRHTPRRSVATSLAQKTCANPTVGNRCGRGQSWASAVRRRFSATTALSLAANRSTESADQAP